MSHRTISRYLALTAVAVLLSGCAKERPAINRVQANAMAKSFFVGKIADPSDDPVFFSRNFVVDASEAQELAGISDASGLERVRWHITEEMLFARRAYAVTGGDDKGTSVEPNGDIVAAYRVQSHFDIRRDYNQSTGEELNVVVENDRDRPWYEREFFRVDWSQNLVESPTWIRMFYGRVFGDLKVTPVAYYESDQHSPNAPHFDAEEGYFDITSHFLVEPQSVEIWGLRLPLCLLMGLYTGSAIYSCHPQEAVVRSSYWRVDHADPNDDFEPFENTNAPRDIFGNPGGMGESASVGLLSPPREEFDPGYGYTDVGMRRYMNILDIWEQSHQTRGACTVDADCVELTGRDGSVCLASGTCSVPCDYKRRADADGNGTDDQCENRSTGYQGEQGAQCSARNRCTVPYRDRQLKAVGYHVNPEMPDALQDEIRSNGDFKSRGPSEDLIYTWNQALQLAIARAREVECRRTGGSRSSCHAEFFDVDGAGRDRVQMVSMGGWGIPTPKDDADVLVTCHNPVRHYDHPVCGTEGDTARVGDLRRHFLIYWPYATLAPYGGIGNWRGDPLTGQIIGATATTIGRSATLSAAEVRDISLVALGALDFEDITGGMPVQRFQKELREGRMPQALSVEELERRTATALRRAEVNATGTAEALNPAQAFLDAQSSRLARLEFITNSVAGPEVLAEAQLRVQAAAQPLLGTALETDLLTPHWVVDALGLSPNTVTTEEVLNQVSPLRGYDLGALSYLDSRVSRDLGLRGVCFMDHASSVGNPDLHGMGFYFRKKYPDLGGRQLAETMYEDIWKEIYKGIQLHEIGHSLGLLHNFASSYDALNYLPQYWQLRTHEGTSTASCGGTPRSGDTSSVANDQCLGPRYLDPETADELGQDSESRPGIAYFGHTSTMEYQNTRFFETVGLGQYDVMTAGALYGRVLETFDSSIVNEDVQRKLEPMLWSQLSDDVLIRLNGDASQSVNDLGTLHYTELARDVRVFSPERCRDATSAERARAEWRIVHGKICTPPAKEYAHWDDFVDDAPKPGYWSISARKLRGRSDGGAPETGNLRWPYRFGGDMSNSYVHINPFDSGADIYEVTREAIRRQEYEYPLVYFRRLRRDWNERRLPSRSAWLFFERLRSYHWNVARTTVNLSPEDISDDNAARPALVAQHEMFHAIAEALLRPELGEHFHLIPNEPSNVIHPLIAPDFREIFREEIEQFGIVQFQVDAVDGRFLAPDYDSDPTGGGSWEYLTYANRAGYSVEKALAARVLSDGRPVLYTIGRNNELDSRFLYVNFRTGMAEQLDRLLGGVLSEQWASTAAFVAGLDSPVNQRNFSDPAFQPPSDAILVNPNVGYRQQLAVLVFAQLFGRVGGDLGLTNKMRVWIDGSVSAEVNVPEAEQIRFTNPESGITYIARKYGTETFQGATIEKGIGSRMLERANQLLRETYETTGQIDEFGRPQLFLDENNAPVSNTNNTLIQRFRNYVGLLDSAVQISTIFGHGPH